MPGVAAPPIAAALDRPTGEVVFIGMPCVDLPELTARLSRGKDPAFWRGR